MTLKNVDLYSVWTQQSEYNDRIKRLKSGDEADWMIDYILGTISELGELLKEMNWKKHRLHSLEDFGPNVSEELADISKYVLSMWQIAGFSQLDMLKAVYRKGEILEQLYWQEVSRSLTGEKIVILDLDGVVADFRQGFSKWITGSHWSSILNIDERDFGLHLDLNNGWEYSTYEEAKLEFERLGGYNYLPPIEKVLEAVKHLSIKGFKILVWTARPNHIYKRIRSDTWAWLMDKEIPAEGLYFGGDERIRAAKKLSESNFVIAFEDNTTLAKRYAISGIPVVLITQPYNVDMERSEKVLRVFDKQTSSDIVHLVERILSYQKKEENA